jgi:threonine/homoserine/homoserine lactone efflux protein
VADSSLTPFIAFSAVAAMLVVTPGAGTALLIATVAGSGRRAGYLTATGLVIGAAIHALAAAVGTSALLRAFPRALEAIAIVGGAFIVALGLRGVIAAVRQRATGVAAEPVPERRRRYVTAGLAIALGNAPLPLFYLVVVPQYVPKGMTPLPGALLLSFIHLTLAATWMATLVTLLGQLADVLRRPRVLLTMQLLTGTVLILLGAKSIGGAI